MKRVSAILLGLMLFVALLPAYAATLADIREQAPVFSAELGIPIILPQAEQAPVLSLMRSPVLPDLSEFAGASYAVADLGIYGVVYNDPVWQNHNQPNMRYNLPKGHTFVWKEVSPPWDISLAYPENNSFTLGEALNFVKSHAVKAMGKDAQMDLFSFSVINSGRTGKAAVWGGYDILPPYGVGAYDLKLGQVIGGWMVMDCINNHLNDDVLGNSRLTTNFRESKVNIASQDAYFIGLSFLSVDKVLAEDVPLCPMDRVIAAYNRLINAGQIPRMSELRLGYVLFPDPDRLGKDVAFPCWLLKCEYLGRSHKKGESFQNMSVEDSPHYAQLLVNAVSGDLISPRINRKQDTLPPSWGK